MLGPGSPMCQFMDASLCDSGADARGRARNYRASRHVFTDDRLRLLESEWLLRTGSSQT